MRWGIFWRTLLFDLKKAPKIIQVAMLLHNFILDNDDREDSRFFQEFRIRMDSVQHEITRQTGEMPVPMVSDNNQPNLGGRPSMKEQEQKQPGYTVREHLTIKLATHEMVRPLQHDMHYNSYGHIYISS
jgi:hypothetical protein